jgi:hypothetical protein
MARIRSVHPSICLSETIADLTAQTERTFIRLWTHCDDYGRAVDKPRTIRAAIYPLNDDVNVQTVSDDLDALEAAGLILRYEVDGERFLFVTSWFEFQKPRHPAASKCPEPPVRNSTPTAPLPRSAVDVPRSAVGRTLEWSGEERSGEEAVSRETPQTKTRSSRVTDPFVISDSMRLWATDKVPHLDVDLCAEEMVNWAQSTDARRVDWVACWRNWCLRVKDDPRKRRKTNIESELDTIEALHDLER